ncbi:hypothetical protein, partial [Leyella stercorea]|uniref:hypothetical protein n=1 Tax=Leyella stercorea TaxID=363265 RepID=UPI00266C2800
SDGTASTRIYELIEPTFINTSKKYITFFFYSLKKDRQLYCVFFFFSKFATSKNKYRKDGF